jgi:3-hydroxymyristoyl/3-hydroxydecanoyl-(acyl carrier protein) dehydratase
LRAVQDVDPRAWPFKAHFFQDPVQPGSIGLESMVQAVAALGRLLGHGTGRWSFVTAPQGMAWKFRGQITPCAHQVITDVSLTAVDRGAEGVTLWAQGRLWADGLCIYEAQSFGVRFAP